MTTDTTALQERLALAISEAEFCRRCEALSMSCEACEARAAAVLPIIAAEVRAAKAEALRAIAPHLNDSGDESFLMGAADRIETGDQA